MLRGNDSPRTDTRQRRGRDRREHRGRPGPGGLHRGHPHRPPAATGRPVSSRDWRRTPA